MWFSLVGPLIYSKINYYRMTGTTIYVAECSWSRMDRCFLVGSRDLILSVFGQTIINERKSSLMKDCLSALYYKIQSECGALDWPMVILSIEPTTSLQFTDAIWAVSSAKGHSIISIVSNNTRSTSRQNNYPYRNFTRFVFNRAQMDN